MRPFTFLSVAALAMLLLPITAHGQPFGIEMATPLDQLGTGATKLSHVYVVNPIKVHPEFSGYFVKATPKAGVCMVRGVGEDHPNDRYGVAIRDVVGAIRTQIEVTYGLGKLNDFLRQGALWKDTDVGASGPSECASLSGGLGRSKAAE